MGRRNRTLHRWVSPAFVTAAVASLIATAAGADEDSSLFIALGVLLLLSLLTLIVTGTVMFLQHYLRSGPRRRV